MIMKRKNFTSIQDTIRSSTIRKKAAKKLGLRKLTIN